MFWMLNKLIFWWKFRPKCMNGVNIYFVNRISLCLHSTPRHLIQHSQHLRLVLFQWYWVCLCATVISFTFVFATLLLSTFVCIYYGTRTTHDGIHDNFIVYVRNEWKNPKIQKQISVNVDITDLYSARCCLCGLYMKTVIFIQTRINRTLDYIVLCFAFARLFQHWISLSLPSAITYISHLDCLVIEK